MSKPTTKIGNITVPANLSQKELLKFLVENKSLLIAEKKSAIKHADAITVGVDVTSRFSVDKDGKLVKAAVGASGQVADNDIVFCVINSTNWLDSHSDVHIPGIWKRSLKNSSDQLHLQEHNMSFAAVIADDSKGYTERIPWKELGLNIPGETEALIFATPLKGRNPYMEDQYRKGFVKNHSVGMRYVTIKLCVNEPDDDYYKEEYANWNSYINQVANKEAAEAQGYFWAVLEAQVVEGSAVVKGSNIMTPTLGFKSAQPASTTEPDHPDNSTGKQDQPPAVDFDKVAKAIFSN